jgi:hypothetical protein
MERGTFVDLDWFGWLGHICRFDTAGSRSTSPARDFCSSKDSPGLAHFGFRVFILPPMTGCPRQAGDLRSPSQPKHMHWSQEARMSAGMMCTTTCVVVGFQGGSHRLLMISPRLLGCGSPRLLMISPRLLDC